MGPALEGFFSHLYLPGEIQTGANLYIAHSLLMLCGGVAAFARSLALPIAAAVTAVFLVACSHWVGNIVYLGCLDQLFGLGFLPACLLLAGQPFHLCWRSAVLVGILLAAVAMAYPAGLLLVLGPTAIAWGYRVLRDRCRCGVVLGRLALTLLVFGVFLNAEVRVLAFETRLQFNAAKIGDGDGGAGRPGETLLSGMLGKERLPAFFGMGSEWGPEFGTYVLPPWAADLRQALAGAACLTLLVGFWHLVRAGRPDLVLSAAIMVTGTLYLLFKEHYPYAAMKALSFIWPILLVAAVFATTALLRIGTRALGMSLAAAALLSVAWCESLWCVPKAYPAVNLPSHSYREYHLLKERLHALTAGAPIALGIQNLNSYLWLEYFLCDEPTQSLTPANPRAGLFPLVSGWPNVVRPALHEALYLLTDGPDIPVGVGRAWAKIYDSESFSLWKRCGGTDSPALLSTAGPRVP